MECDDDSGNGTLYRSDMSGTNITLVSSLGSLPSRHPETLLSAFRSTATLLSFTLLQSIVPEK